MMQSRTWPPRVEWRWSGQTWTSFDSTRRWKGIRRFAYFVRGQTRPAGPRTADVAAARDRDGRRRRARPRGGSACRDAPARAVPPLDRLERARLRPRSRPTRAGLLGDRGRDAVPGGRVARQGPDHGDRLPRRPLLVSRCRAYALARADLPQLRRRRPARVARVAAARARPEDAPAASEELSAAPGRPWIARAPVSAQIAQTAVFDGDKGEQVTLKVTAEDRALLTPSPVESGAAPTCRSGSAPMSAGRSHFIIGRNGAIGRVYPDGPHRGRGGGRLRRVVDGRCYGVRALPRAEPGMDDEGSGRLASGCARPHVHARRPADGPDAAGRRDLPQPQPRRRAPRVLDSRRDRRDGARERAGR